MSNEKTFEKEIFFNKGKAIRLNIFYLIINSIYWIGGMLILNYFLLIFGFGGFTIPYLDYLIYAILAIQFLSFLWSYFTIRTLRYWVGQDRVIKKYTVLTKTIDTARLQVINSVDISQSIIGRILDLYDVKISYGFSEEGYEFIFNYLSEQDAEYIMEKVKPTGLQVVKR